MLLILLAIFLILLRCSLNCKFVFPLLDSLSKINVLGVRLCEAGAIDIESTGLMLYEFLVNAVRVHKDNRLGTALVIRRH